MNKSLFDAYYFWQSSDFFITCPFYFDTGELFEEPRFLIL